eukprot:gene9707-10693_t
MMPSRINVFFVIVLALCIANATARRLKNITATIDELTPPVDVFTFEDGPPSDDDISFEYSSSRAGNVNASVYSAVRSLAIKPGIWTSIFKFREILMCQTSNGATPKQYFITSLLIPPERKKSINERKQLLMKNRICFRCCSSTAHQAKDCKESVKCSSCNSNRHLLAMHIGPAVRFPAQEDDGGENTVIQAQQRLNESSPLAGTNVSNACAYVCVTVPGGKSCSNICKVEIFDDNTGRSTTVYAVIDDQSNSTLAKITNAFFSVTP